MAASKSWPNTTTRWLDLSCIEREGHIWQKIHSSRTFRMCTSPALCSLCRVRSLWKKASVSVKEPIKQISAYSPISITILTTHMPPLSTSCRQAGCSMWSLSHALLHHQYKNHRSTKVYMATTTKLPPPKKMSIFFEFSYSKASWQRFFFLDSTIVGEPNKCLRSPPQNSPRQGCVCNLANSKPTTWD